VSPSEAAASRQFGKNRRLRRRAEFQKVFDSGQRIRGRFLTLLVAKSEASRTRLGIVASRKLGDAVRRNRAKRLIREIFRRFDPPELPAGVDVVIIPRIELFGASYESVDEDFRAVFVRGLARLKRT
jgi:ribonuclease P protein component